MAEWAKDLPENVVRVLTDLLRAMREAFAEDLASVVLFGSAAEGKLRATSDVNLVVVLRKFDAAKAKQIQEPVRVAQAAIDLQPMFLLESEVTGASEAFANKFADIVRRHRVLYGSDPFTSLEIPRAAQIVRVKQVLLNVKLRLREGYVMRGLREEQLALLAAESAGPLRSCAVTLLGLEGRVAASPRAALEEIVRELSEKDWLEVLGRVSNAREERILAPGLSGATVLRLIDLAGHMHDRASRLQAAGPP
jgi:predicted nucleotidyltransferase